MQRELDGAYADSYWTNYYNSNAFMWPDADYGSLGSYGNEFYWNDPLLSGDPFDFNSYGSVYDFSPYDDFGYGNRSFDYGSSFYDDPLYQDYNGLGLWFSLTDMCW